MSFIFAVGECRELYTVLWSSNMLQYADISEDKVNSKLYGKP